MAEVGLADVIAGKVQRERRANLANPWVKLALFLLPACLAFLLLGMIGVHYASLGTGTTFNQVMLGPFILLGTGTWLAQTLDFRPAGRAVTISTTVVCVTIVVIVILDQHQAIDVKKAADWPVVSGILAIVQRVMSAAHILVITLLGIAARGFFLIYPTDAIAISGIFYWRPLMKAYETLVILYFVIENSIGRRFSAAGTASITRCKLMRVTRPWSRCIGPAALVFVKRLLQELKDMARVCQSTLADRGWYNREFSQSVAQPWNPEDFVAVMMMLATALLVLLTWV